MKPEARIDLRFFPAPAKVMIRVPNWVGDAVMAVPALRELRRIFSACHITLVARPWVAGLFDGEGLADDLVTVSRPARLLETIGSFLKDARRLRRERFDLAILLQNAFGAALMARAAGVRKVAGYATDRRRPLLDTVIPLPPGYKTNHQVFYYLNVAKHIEEMVAGESRINLKEGEPRLEVAAKQKERARELLEQSGIRLTGGDYSFATPQRIVALNPGATNSRAKQWLPERFAETADRLADREGFQTIIIGAAGDTEAANDTARLMRTRAVVLAGQTDIRELKAVLALTALVISNDTGTAHVSAALGVPTIAVFGPTEHVSTRPLSAVAAVVRHDVECSPCMLRDCPIDHRCMTRVEVDDVYGAARSLLRDAAGRGEAGLSLI